MDIEDLRRSSYWSEREGQRAVELWRESGLTLLEFSTRTGLRRQRISYWSSRAAQPTSSSAKATAMVLAPVTVVRSQAASAITIELRSGRAVRLEGDFADDVLERVIAIAERAC
jgi:hypothetical protein